MGDFGSILWIAIIVSAMIFNFRSQARKAREKRGHAPQHTEAWPPSGEAGVPAPSAAPKMPQRPVFQPVTPAFGDEGQSLEEIPVEEYTPSFTTQRAADTGLMRNQTADRLTTDRGTSEIGAQEFTGDAEEASTAAEIAEEFDLRQAVIYSEILKPKFEE